MGKKISISQFREDVSGFNMYGVEIADPLSCLGTVQFFSYAEVLHTISPTIVLSEGNDTYIMIRDIIEVEKIKYGKNIIFKLQCKNHYTSIPISAKIYCTM